MSLVRPIRKSSRGLISYRVLIMCIAALSLLSVRIAPPSLPHMSTGLAATSAADHDHRLFFDHEDSQWATTPSIAVNAPPPVVSRHPTPSVEPSLEIVKEGSAQAPQPVCSFACYSECHATTPVGQPQYSYSNQVSEETPHG